MGVTMKKISVILLLVTFLTPGFAQARVFSFEGNTVTRATDTGFFSVVWNLLTGMFDKNGGMLDPNGAPQPTDNTGDETTTATAETDNGGMLDPNGGR